MKRVYILAAASLLSFALAGCPSKMHKRSDPVCALRDCASGKIIDDGCSDDGRCASCVSPCGTGITPTQVPPTATPPSR
jgi:hypothetical protein